MGDTSSAAEYLKELRQRREEALNEVGEAYDALQRAKERYADALLSAHDYGCSNVMIADRIKLSETAVRTFLKRKRQRMTEATRV